MAETPQELIVVLPVFNEEASIQKVITAWFDEISRSTEAFTFLCLDDGSTDKTPDILTNVKAQLGPRLEIHHHQNRGHGQTCVTGYRMACARHIPYVLQIDSDGQSDPRYFHEFWKLRKRFQVVYGIRRTRNDGRERKIISTILRLTLLTLHGVNCADANVPYRMMQTNYLLSELEMIPLDFHLANVALAVILKRNGWSHGYVPISFPPRCGGEPTLKLEHFGKRAIELHRQLKKL